MLHNLCYKFTHRSVSWVEGHALFEGIFKSQLDLHTVAQLVWDEGRRFALHDGVGPYRLSGCLSIGLFVGYGRNQTKSI